MKANFKNSITKKFAFKLDSLCLSGVIIYSEKKYCCEYPCARSSINSPIQNK